MSEEKKMSISAMGSSYLGSSYLGTGITAYSLVPSIAMVPTCNLRYSKTGRLQQEWYDYNGSEHREWRDVPTEE